jgi:D-threo-aldose 1-dehydrogenase
MDPSQRNPVGDTGVLMSRLGMGTGPLGRYQEPEHWREVFDTAWGAGVRSYDTSPFYGFGNSERRLGAILRTMPRDEFALSTKVGRLLRDVPTTELFAQQYFYPDGIPDDVLRPVYDYSRDGVLRSFEESHDRLGLERVDTLLVHDIIELTSGVSHADQCLDEALPALSELRAQGRIGAIGVGVQDNPLLARMVRGADLDLCLLAGRYTLLDQGALEEALPACLERGVRIMIGSPYNTGILHDPKPESTFDFAPAPPGLIAKALELKAVCERHGVPLPAAAMQFPFGHPAIVTVLTGAENAAEFRENVAMMQVDIPEALWHELRDSGLIDPRAPLPCEAAHAEANRPA